MKKIYAASLAFLLAAACPCQSLLDLIKTPSHAATSPFVLPVDGPVYKHEDYLKIDVSSDIVARTNSGREHRVSIAGKGSSLFLSHSIRIGHRLGQFYLEEGHALDSGPYRDGATSAHSRFRSDRAGAAFAFPLGDRSSVLLAITDRRSRLDVSSNLLAVDLPAFGRDPDLSLRVPERILTAAAASEQRGWQLAVALQRVEAFGDLLISGKVPLRTSIRLPDDFSRDRVVASISRQIHRHASVEAYGFGGRASHSAPILREGGRVVGTGRSRYTEAGLGVKLNRQLANGSSSCLYISTLRSALTLAGHVPDAQDAGLDLSGSFFAEYSARAKLDSTSVGFRETLAQREGRQLESEISIDRLPPSAVAGYGAGFLFFQSGRSESIHVDSYILSLAIRYSRPLGRSAVDAELSQLVPFSFSRSGVAGSRSKAHGFGGFSFSIGLHWPL